MSSAFMILFIGDLHYDPEALASDNRVSGRDDERALTACLRMLDGKVGHVVLLGDVFDAYIEYRTLVPRGPVRLLGLLAEWADRGIPVKYAVGNHDPWHRRFVEADLGIELVTSARTLTMDGHRIHIAHGDVEERGGAGWVHRLVRHPTTLALYSGLLPGDAGQRLAGAVSRRFRTHDPSPKTVALLRDYALKTLSEGSADVVAMGHSHVPDLVARNNGGYVNPGMWRSNRTLGIFDDAGLRLERWNGSTLVPVDLAT